MTASKDYTKELTALYKRTYGEARYISSLENVSTLVADDGKKYVIGLYRNKNERYSSSEDYEPHMHSSGIVFAATLDEQENLTGDSIRIKGESEESCHFSETYKRKKVNYSLEELLKQRKSYTFISIDINQGDDLPRTVLCSDKSIQGGVFGDYSTKIDGYYNMTDRAEFLRAAFSNNHDPRYQNSEKNQKVAVLCSQFLIPDISDEKYRKEESERLARKQEQEALNQRIEKRQALRKFIEREKERKSKGLKNFGSRIIQNPARKALAKRMLPKLIAIVQIEKLQKAE